MTVTEIIAIALVKYGPTLARALFDVFQKQTPTAEDWDKVFQLADKSYESYEKGTP